MDDMINKKKITLAVTSFSGGGAEKVMVTLANKFIDLGYLVDFIVGQDKGPYRSMLSSAVNKVVLAEGSAGRIAKGLSAFKVLRQYLNRTDSRVLMSTIRELNIFVGIVKILSLSDIRHIVREADTLDRLFVYGGLSNRLLLSLMKWYYPKSNHVIANCQVTASDLMLNIANIENKVSVVYNPLNISEIREKVSSVGLASSNKKVIACGRLSRKKNFGDLIKAMPLVQTKYPNVKLEILGEGSERSYLQQIIDELNLNEVVKLLGFVSNPYEYYASADVFVQTSLWEGFGYVLVEAMACGTPVVAYDSKGAMKEILDNGKYGLLTPVNNLNALADAIIQQIEAPTPKSVLDEAVERFRVDQIASKYLDILDD